MATAEGVWGIDIGRCALKAIKLRPAGDDKAEVVAFDYVEHAKILSQPDADRPALISAALEKFLSRNDVSKVPVVVSVPGQHTLARFTKLPPVAPKRVPDIVRYEADQQIPFDMDEVIWDYQTFQQEGTPDIEVGIFAMKRELIREHLLHFEQAAIEPIVVQSGPLAVYNAAHFEGLLHKDTTVLLDIGSENTDLVIATPHGLWTRTVPIGGNSFTEALVKSFKLSFSKAETLKRTASTSKYARQIFQAMRPIFADLVQELQRSIGFYSSTHRDANVEKVVAVGNACLLPGLQKYLQQNLGIDVERPDAFRSAAGGSAVAQSTFKEQLLSFVVAYGLALQGLDRTKVTSNLLPTELAKQAVWRKKRPAFAAAAACLLLAGGLVWFRQISDRKALAAASEGADAVTVRDIDDAAAIIDNGPLPGLSDRAMATAIVQAGQLLNKELSQRGKAGEFELAQMGSLIHLQRNKTVVPAVLDIVHRAVPQFNGASADVRGAADVRQAVQSGQLPPREQRNEVWIQSLDIVFEPDLKLFPWESVIDVPQPMNNHDNDGEGELPGLLLKIECISPNAGGAGFLRDSFINSLRTAGRQPGRGFYVDHVILAEGTKLEAGPDKPGPGAPTMGRGGFAGLSTRRETQNFDVVTNEPTDGDWRFTVRADVILQDLPESAMDQEKEQDGESEPDPEEEG